MFCANSTYQWQVEFFKTSQLIIIYEKLLSSFMSSKAENSSDMHSQDEKKQKILKAS